MADIKDLVKDNAGKIAKELNDKELIEAVKDKDVKKAVKIGVNDVVKAVSK